MNQTQSLYISANFYAVIVATHKGSCGTSHWILHFQYLLYFYALNDHQNQKLHDRIRTRKTISPIPAFRTCVYFLR